MCLMQASRKDLTDKPNRAGKLFKYDVSLKPSEMSGFVDAVRRGLTTAGRRVLDGVSAEADCSEEDTGLEICTFGHVGDGNMHLNILVREMDSSRVTEYKQILNDVIFKEVAMRRGSISAEHGIGQKKVTALFRDIGIECDGSGNNSEDSMSDENTGDAAAVRSRSELLLMRAIKAAIDPRGIMNPGKVFPAPSKWVLERS